VYYTKGVKSFVDSQRQHRGVTNKPTHVGIEKSGFNWRERKGHHLFSAKWETELLQQLSRLGTGKF
jgi:hypothetical protein